MSSRRPAALTPADTGRMPALTDVAREASVSHQTVSRVINGHPNVSDATRARVLAAIEALSYRPNLAARALATGRSSVIGLITHNTTLFGPVGALYGVEEAARSAGYSVSITSVSLGDRVSLAQAVMRLTQQAVAGLIVIAPLEVTGSVAAVLPPELPTVAVAADPGVGVPSVLIDHARGASLATRHLLELGHRTVWHVAGHSDYAEALQRVQGWHGALKDAGAEVPDVIAGDWSAHSGYKAGCRLAQRHDVTAIFAANDTMALGLLRALAEHGRSVPEDVSVVGFDDVAEAAFYSPPLTTVAQNFNELGSRAVGLLLGQLGDDTNQPRRSVLEPQLVVRASTLPPRTP